MPLAVPRLLAAILVSVLCAQLSIISINSAGANTNYYRAQNSLATKADTLPTDNQVTDAHLYISLAANQMPMDADILDLAGRVDYFRAIYEQDPRKKLALLSLSKKNHLTALEQRQLWPYSEVNILYSSSAAGEIDDEFLQRFSRAKTLGPDDRSVIRDLARLGIKNWNDLSGQAKRETVQLTELVLKRNLISKRSLRSFMYNNGQFHRICAQLDQFKEKQAFCNS